MMSPNESSSAEELSRNVKQLWHGLQTPVGGGEGGNHANSDARSGNKNDFNRYDDDGDDEYQIHRHSTKRMLMREAKRALLAWIVIYACMFVCLLGYRWQAKAYYEADYERKLAAVTAAIAAQGQEQELQLKLQQDQNDKRRNSIQEPWWIRENLMSQVDQAIANLQTVQERQQAETANISQYFRTVEEILQKLSTFDISDTPGDLEQKRTVKSTQFLERLLERQALTDIESTSDLNRLFTSAMSELKEMIESSGLVQWQSLQEALSKDFPEKTAASLEEDSTIFECPSHRLQDSSIEELYREAAFEDDMGHLVTTIESAIAQRTSWKEGEILDSTFADTERLIGQNILDAMQSIVSLASASDKASRGNKQGSREKCMQEEEVLEMLEEGLMALRNHANLRNVLRKKAIDMDPSASSIILDADLPQPTPRIPRRETTNLRRVLDTPMLPKIASAVDSLVEAAGGYNDQLDQWIDSFAGSHKSVGDMVVQHVLQKSGKVEIPRIEMVVREKLPPQVQSVLKTINLV